MNVTNIFDVTFLPELSRAYLATPATILQKAYTRRARRRTQGTTARSAVFRLKFNKMYHEKQGANAQLRQDRKVSATEIGQKVQSSP